MLNIAVLVSGGGTNLQALLDSEARGENPNGRITLVVASKPGVYALERAAKAGVEGCVVRRKDYASSEDFDAALLKTLKDHNIDLVVLAGLLSVLGPSVIAAYPRRILNVHPALIPSFCGPGMYGLRPHEAALARGCKVTGATVHFVNEECDGGPILLQKAVDILPGDTPEVLQKRVMEQAEWKLLPKAVAMVCSGDAGVYGMASPVLELAGEYPEVDVEVVAGVTAALSGGAVLGAPLGHDFCVISLSDLLTPWEVIEKRLESAAEGDFAICLYNPSSKKRKDHLRRACEILLKTRSGDTVCGWVRNIGREGQEHRILTLEQLQNAEVDMFTTVFIGSSRTRCVEGRMVTPRGYEKKCEL